MDVAPDELASRFALSGLNHESTTTVDGDTVIDLEVTSNRGDCLGHIGVAREASVLLNRTLKVPQPTIPSASLLDTRSIRFLSIQNEFVDGALAILAVSSGSSNWSARIGFAVA